jgi:enoyl-CoA hydratase/carnithine racemase
MAAAEVLLERPCEGVALVSFNRPDQMNAIRPSTVSALLDVVGSLVDDGSTRVVVLTGTGRGFCSGMDLSAVDEFPQQDLSVATAWMRNLFQGALALSQLPQPTIAAVNGPAIGGGFGFALGCDIRIAAPTARFAATFVKIAMGPDAGLSHTLPRTVGHARALELLLTADAIDAEEALRLGIVSRVADDPVAAALVLAGRIAAVPGHVSRGIKATLRRAAAADLPTTIADIEAPAQAEHYCHPDFFTNAGAWLSAHS